MIFNPVLFANRLARNGFDCELIFSNSFFRSDRSVFTTRRTAAIGVADERLD